MTPQIAEVKVANALKPAWCRIGVTRRSVTEVGGGGLNWSH